MTAPQSPPGHEAVAASDEVSPLALLSLLLQHWRFMIAVPVALVFVVAAVTLTRPRLYLAESKFLPQATEQRQTGLSSLAAQFGVSLSGAVTGSESADFYMDLARTRDVRSDLVRTRYRFGAGRDTLEGDLSELLHITARTDEERIRRTIDVLDQRMSLNQSLRTGVVSVEIAAPWPELAVQLNRRLLELMSQFNLEKRQSRAAAERRFVEERVAQAAAELRTAESALKGFLERNRRFEDSPELRFEARRLERTVDLRQQVFLSVTQAYEQARIDEVRDTPVFTVLDRAEGSVRPRGRGLILKSLMAGVAGVFLAALLVLIGQYARLQRERNPEEYGLLRARLQAIARAVLPRRLAARLGGQA